MKLEDTNDFIADVEASDMRANRPER
jgi:hypothetical protein